MSAKPTTSSTSSTSPTHTSHTAANQAPCDPLQRPAGWQDGPRSRSLCPQEATCWPTIVSLTLVLLVMLSLLLFALVKQDLRPASASSVSSRSIMPTSAP